MFRNVDQSPDTPPDEWSDEVLEAVIYYGWVGDVSELTDQIYLHGEDSEFTNRVRVVLEYCDPEYAGNYEFFQSLLSEPLGFTPEEYLRLGELL